MLVRALCATALLAYSPIPAVPQTLVEQQILEPVPLVDCGEYAGTAFRVGPNLLISVNHVAKLKGCMIDGEPEHIVYMSVKRDFAMLSDDREAHWLKVDCGGFVRGREYLAIGHARAVDSLAIVPLIATGEKEDGYSVLIGIFTAQPGQSGGPIVDAQTHAVVGVVNAANWEDGTTFSVELKDSPVCGGDGA